MMRYRYNAVDSGESKGGFRAVVLFFTGSQEYD